MSDRCCFASRFVDSYWQRAAVVPARWAARWAGL